MELQVYVSKKGTKVVSATNLHQALQLADHHYPSNVKSWLLDLYEFRDGIRRPVRMQDYAPRKVPGNTILKDYYLTIEMAKLIVLASKSKAKLKYAKWLHAMEDEPQQGELLSKEQVCHIIELAKAMGMVSCQEAAEKRHLKIYEQRNGGDAVNWWKYRAGMLGYSTESLREKLRLQGKKVRGKTQRQMLMLLDPYEMIRTGVIDLFMGMGKSEHYARSMGDLAKSFARELKLEVFDDRNGALLFAPKTDDRLVSEIKAFEQAGRLSAWS
jgi:phage anti-repressor protein